MLRQPLPVKEDTIKGLLITPLLLATILAGGAANADGVAWERMYLEGMRQLGALACNGDTIPAQVCIFTF